MKYALSNVFGDPFWLTTVPMALVGWAVTLVGSIINSSMDSKSFPVFSWWGIAFEMIAILLTLHVAFTHQIRMYRQAILAFLAIATVYTTNSTNNFVWRDNSSSGAAAAGNILLSIINFIWILYFGTTQDEPAHMYIDSFAVRKKANPVQAEFQRRMRERRRMATNSTLSGPQTNGQRQSIFNSRLGTTSQPYRMSDIPRDVAIGTPKDFTRQTDPTNISGVPQPTASQGSNPLNSTYLYSVDQLHHHGLNSHEVADDQQQANAQDPRVSLGSIIPQNNEDPYFEDNADEDGYDSNHPIAKARARFSYVARLSDGELPFKEGDLLDICDMTGNWWYCKRADGEVGICPRNYLELLDEPLV